MTVTTTRGDQAWFLGRAIDEAWFSSAKLSFGADAGVELEVLVPRSEAVPLIFDELRDARERHLACLPIDVVVDVLGTVASRWRTADDPFRLEAERLLPAVTGFSRE